MVPYPAEVQHAAAAELDALAPEAVLRRLVEDYGELRARARAACGRE